MDRKHNPQLVQNARELRKNMTREERHLWYDFLRDYSVRFTRQKVLGKYIVDFYCAKAKLIVEVDGTQHFEEQGAAYDRERTAYLAQYGLQVIRISNNRGRVCQDTFCGFSKLNDLSVKKSPKTSCLQMS